MFVLVIRKFIANVRPASACFGPIPLMMRGHCVGYRCGRPIRKPNGGVAEKLVRFAKATKRNEHVSWFKIGVEAIRVCFPQTRPLIEGG